MILLSGRGCVGRNVKYRAEGTQWRQSYKVQGSMVTKLHSLDCWHYPEVGFLVKKTHSKGEFNFRSSWSIVYIFSESLSHRNKMILTLPKYAAFFRLPTILSLRQKIPTQRNVVGDFRLETRKCVELTRGISRSITFYLKVE